jgi:HEPN domain-containing protein
MPGPPDYFEVLLKKARQDYDAASQLAASDTIADEVIGFHCQQAVEKSIKAVLESRQSEYPLTHDIVGLIAMLAQADISCPIGLDEAIALNQFAVRFRYDLLDIMQTTQALNRAHMTNLAAKVLAWAEAQIRKA